MISNYCYQETEHYFGLDRVLFPLITYGVYDVIVVKEISVTPLYIFVCDTVLLQNGSILLSSVIKYQFYAVQLRFRFAARQRQGCGLHVHSYGHKVQLHYYLYLLDATQGVQGHLLLHCVLFFQLQYCKMCVENI